ncbi:MAG: hypothetical protein JWO82_2799, partial [Akkermansiaceae bacterium]|nr:hypothetical protein [Akkermansiaceae bacterium]
LQVELKIAFGANGEVIRQIFWITPKQDPEVMMRQLTQQARQGGGVVTPGGNQPPRTNPDPNNPNPPHPGPRPGPKP